MRNILLLSILCFFSKLNAEKEEILIKHFVRDLFDINIPEHTGVSKYFVELKNEKKFSISLDERKEIRLGHIKQIRLEMQKN